MSCSCSKEEVDADEVEVEAVEADGEFPWSSTSPWRRVDGDAPAGPPSSAPALADALADTSLPLADEPLAEDEEEASTEGEAARARTMSPLLFVFFLDLDLRCCVAGLLEFRGDACKGARSDAASASLHKQEAAANTPGALCASFSRRAGREVAGCGR